MYQSGNVMLPHYATRKPIPPRVASCRVWLAASRRTDWKEGGCA